jgi:hypothetical protein
MTTTAVSVSCPGVSDTSVGRFRSSSVKIRAPGAVNERTSAEPSPVNLRLARRRWVA